MFFDGIPAKVPVNEDAVYFRKVGIGSTGISRRCDIGDPYAKLFKTVYDPLDCMSVGGIGMDRIIDDGDQQLFVRVHCSLLISTRECCSSKSYTLLLMSSLIDILAFK
jgi:hypothetical protein